MQCVFKRYEEKYLITSEQFNELIKIVSERIAPDSFGEYLVQNLYFDTENWDVIRSSINKPYYKEKLRLRCYNIPNEESMVFLELKKKYKGIVYKRRIPIPYKELSFYSMQDLVSAGTSQITQELDFYLKKSAALERIYIGYKRIAFAGEEPDDLRVTFDSGLRFRLEHLDFYNPKEGKIILPKNTIMMEIKTNGGMPLWMARALSENAIFPRAFSKYAECWADLLLMKQTDIERKERISA